MKVAIRTDAALEIGSGHVMRCLALADALRANGAEISFLCRSHPGDLVEQLERRGYRVEILTNARNGSKAYDLTSASLPHQEWLGVTQSFDAQQCVEALGTLTPDWLIVDHYALDAQWESALRPHCRAIMVIDDLANRLHDCDVLLDQSLGRTAEDYAALAPPKCRLIVGPRFALLRPEFALKRPESLARRQNAEFKNLLIAMGGVDKDNASGKVLKALRNCAMPRDSKITVVMGDQAPWHTAIREEASTMPWRTEVLVGIKDMASLMSDSDLAIGAAGFTSWERCCIGLPSIVLILAENQRQIAKHLELNGAAILIGDPQELERLLAPTLNPLISSITKRREMIQSCAYITDGTGVAAVKAVLEQ